MFASLYVYLKIDDHAELTKFFSGYNTVIERLRARGYEYAKIRLPYEVAEIAMSFEPFDPKNSAQAEVLSHIASYRK